AARVLPALHVEHEVAFAGQRWVVRLLPAELEDVASQVAGEVSDDFLALPLVDPDAVQVAGRQATLAVVGLDLHRAQCRAPQAERAGAVHRLRRWRVVLAVGPRRGGRLALAGVRGGGRRSGCGETRSEHRNDPRKIADAHRAKYNAAPLHRSA